MNILTSGLKTFARGGGCFLAHTEITVPGGVKHIELFKPGDTVTSFNEATHKLEHATVERLDVLAAREYYTLNGRVNVTGDHPFYVNREGKTSVRKVNEIVIGDKLITIKGSEVVETIVINPGDVVVYNLINVVPNHNYFADGYLVHNKGGGHASVSHASVSHTSTAKTSTAKPAAPKTTAKPTTTTKTTTTTTKTTAKPVAKTAAKPAVKTSSKPGTSKAKPGSTIKTADGKSVKSSTAKPLNHKYSTSEGIVGDNGYTPQFRSGYTAPYGSVVYYESHSALDYLPWIYLFSQNNSPAQQYQTATVVQPNGQQTVQKPVSSGVDGLVILNWFILVVLALAIVGGIVWGVNKMTKSEQ